MSSDDSKVKKVETHFEVLSSVAFSLNTASDELTKVVGILDESLKKLNIGLTTWVAFRSRGLEHPYYDEDQIGYCKVKGTWGIALRHIWGNEAWDDYNDEGPWLFNDAPRELRLHSVDKIPDLIEALGREASDVTKKIRAKTHQVRELAEVVEKVASEQSKAKGSK